MKRTAQPLQLPIAGEQKTRQLLEQSAAAAAFMCIAILLIVATVLVGVLA